MVGAEVILCLLPQPVVVLALDDIAAYADDLLHGCIVAPLWSELGRFLSTRATAYAVAGCGNRPTCMSSETWS